MSTPSITLLHGENLATLENLCATWRERITLAYLDPPFLTGRQHRMSDGSVAFDDRWSSVDAFCASLFQRVQRVRDLLASHGSMVLHLDSKTSHRTKVGCDEIFGASAFASEIIWRYRRWPSKTSNFQRVHDVLLRYRKDPKTPPRWNQLFEAPAASTVETWGTGKQRAIIDESGKRIRSSATNNPSPGVPMGDVWEIGVVAPISRERTGYPTQKPEALLERLILALTDPGDIVLDPYMGSGTTIAVAQRLGRAAIGIDSSSAAIEVARARLKRKVEETQPSLFGGSR